MSFLTGTLNLIMYEDSAQTEVPLLQQPNISQAWSNSAVGGALKIYLNLAASTTQAISLNGISNITEFYLFSDTTALTLTLNGNTLTYKAAVPGYVPIAVTSLSITNASGSSATNVSLILIKG